MQYRIYSLLFLLIMPLAFIQAQEKSEDHYRRVLSARIFFNNKWVIEDEKPADIVQVIAQFEPTYVSGLLYFNGGTLPKEATIQAFKKVKKGVQAQSPNCLFDIVINPNDYKKPEDIVAKMTAINALIKPEVWYLDFMPGPHKASSRVLEAAIEYAHQEGQQIGGNSLEKELLKNGDFVAVHDGMEINLELKELTRSMAEEYSIPILFQINNDSSRSLDDTIHTFIKKWKTYERERHIRRLAQNQVSWQYRLMYPVFFPVYLHQKAYQVQKDEEMVPLWKEFMERYN